MMTQREADLATDGEGLSGHKQCTTNIKMCALAGMMYQRSYMRFPAMN